MLKSVMTEVVVHSVLLLELEMYYMMKSYVTGVLNRELIEH